MRHMSCDQIDSIIAFHSALQSDSAVNSCFTDSSKDSEKSAPSGVRPGSSTNSKRLVLKRGRSWFSSGVTI